MMKYKKTLASILLILISFVCSAQTPPPPQPPPGPPGVPVDGSLYVLLVVGIIYGILKIYQTKRKSL